MEQVHANPNPAAKEDFPAVPLSPEPVDESAANPVVEGSDDTAVEEEQRDGTVPPARWDTVIQLTAEEIRSCLQRADRRRMGKWRILIYAVLLGFISVSSLVSFFLNGMHNGMTLFLGIGGLALFLMVVLYEPVSLRRMVKREAAAGKKLHLWVYEDRLGFGEGETFETYTFSEFYVKKFEDLLILHFARGLLVAIPRRTVPADCWDFLSARLPEEKPQTKRR